MRQNYTQCTIKTATTIISNELKQMSSIKATFIQYFVMLLCLFIDLILFPLTLYQFKDTVTSQITRAAQAAHTAPFCLSYPTRSDNFLNKEIRDVSFIIIIYLPNVVKPPLCICHIDLLPHQSCLFHDNFLPDINCHMHISAKMQQYLYSECTRFYIR